MQFPGAICKLVNLNGDYLAVKTFAVGKGNGDVYVDRWFV